MRLYLALFIGKLAHLAIKIISRFTGMKGTNFPGTIALKICPDFIRRVSKPAKVVVVTGTNGKTTLSNLISETLTDNGYKVLNNKDGSNINTGIASCLLDGVNLLNREKYEVAVLEVDERSSIRIFPYMDCDYVICTNLSRDSLMRNAHPFYIRDMLDEYLPDRATMILNADDLISSALKPNSRRIYYGVSQMEGDTALDESLVNDARVCPKCHSLLKFRFMKYNQIGQAYCPNCGFESEKPEYVVTDIDYKAGYLTVSHKEESQRYKIISDTIFNIYNECAAVTFLRNFGLTSEQISRSFESRKVVTSRFDVEHVNGIKITSIMAKGMIAPACSAVLDYVRKQPEEKEVVLFLEDKHENETSVENTTWIYDCDFEFLNQKNIRSIIITGQRRYDFYLRLLLAGVDDKIIKVVEDSRKASEALSGKYDVYILHDLYAIDERELIIKSLKGR